MASFFGLLLIISAIKTKSIARVRKAKNFFLRHPTILVVYPVIRMINPVFWIQDSKINP